MNLSELFFERFLSQQNKQALVFYDGKKFHEQTYNELYYNVWSLAEGLVQRGAKKGDIFAFAGKNNPAWIEACLACFTCGMIFAPVSFRLSAKELLEHLEHCEEKWLFADEEQIEKLNGNKHARKFLKEIHAFKLSDIHSLYLSPSVKISEVQKPSTTDDAILHYTAGTTGEPKACMRTHERFLNVMQDMLREFEITSGDVHLVASSLSHSAPGRFTLAHLLAGGSVAVLPEFDAEEFLRAVQNFGVTTAFVVPTMLKAILNLSEKTRKKYDLRSLRALICAGAPFPVKLKEEALEFFGEHCVYEFYGATELATMTVLSPKDFRRKIKSVGKPIEGCEIKIVKDDGTLAQPNEPGEIFVKNNASYSRLIAISESSKSSPAPCPPPPAPSDFLSVGDIGFLDEDGFLYLSGRKKNMLITGGINVYAEEVEKALHHHPDIFECCVFGAPDEYWGERVCAAIVTKSEKPIDENELKNFLLTELATYEVPKQFFFVRKLPRNAAGKIDRKKVLDCKS